MSNISELIENMYESKQIYEDYPTLRASEIGEPCARKLWYKFRWVIDSQRWSGRMLRLFETGHREELRMIENLKSIGLEVSDQQRKIPPVVFKKLTGSIDGIVKNLSGDEKTPYLLECKTHNDTQWKSFHHHGVERSHPKHWAQVQVYMGSLKLDKCLYFGQNKNTDELHVQFIKFDEKSYKTLEKKAYNIIFSHFIPEKISDKKDYWLCKFCSYNKVCHDKEPSRVTCRSCKHASYYEDSEDGELLCNKHGMIRTTLMQHESCSSHEFLKDLQ